MGSSGVGRLWGHARSLYTRQRYHGVTDARHEDQAELIGVPSLHSQPSAFSLSSFPSFSTIPQASLSSNTKHAPVDEDYTLLELRAGDGETAAATRAEIVDPISRTRKTDWIDGVYICARAAALVLLVNLVFIAIAAGLARRYPDNGSFSSSVVLYRGNCGVSKRWDTALHLIINVLSTCILAASNYCMQTLVAPTREEVDAHHAQRKWLDIGSASVKNLSAVGRDRLALWVILMLTATPFHLMYNSMVFTSYSTNEFGAIVGPGDLDSSNVWNLTTPALEKCFSCPVDKLSMPAQLSWHEFASEIADGNYMRISTQQCIQTSKTAQMGIKGIVALADNLTVSDGGNSSILLTQIATDNLQSGINYFQSSLLPAIPFFNQTVGLGSATTCQNERVILNYEDANYGNNPYTVAFGRGVNAYNITGCLAIKAPEHCQLLYSPPICVVIMLAGCAKVAAMFLAARIGRGRSPPLLTVGDAIASFLTRPDPTTKGLCWMAAADIHKGQWRSTSGAGGFSMIPQNNPDEAITYKRLSKRKPWRKAASRWRWTATLFMCLSSIIVGISLLVLSLGGGIDQSYSLISINDIKQWFSSDVNIASYGIIGQDDVHWTMLSSVVVANIPQLVITISYYCYNAVLTSMLAAAEYSSYGVKRKALRVTWPIKGSQQRSTYWLSIPYRYGAPILVIYMILHWLVSQSIFYLMLIPYDPHDQPDPPHKISSLGYSSTPIFLSILVGAIMMLILFSLALRKFKSVIPLAGSSSAAISAACHPPKDENLDTPALGLVKWGQTINQAAWVVDSFQGIDDQQGHCSFTSLDTVRPTLTKLYA